MRKKNKLVHGIGINDLDEQVYINCRAIKAYDCWCQVLNRCYSIKSQIKRPTYVGCTVCDEWKYFSNFKKWHDENYREGFHLDKDILIEGNKVYSPETCVFVPQYLNAILNDHGRARGDLPLGITACKPSPRNRKVSTTYRAMCHDGHGKQISKTFKTLEEAVAWYSATKKRVISEQVQRALNEGAIDQRVADALLRRKLC